MAGITGMISVSELAKTLYGNKEFRDEINQMYDETIKEEWKKNFLRLKDIKINSENIDGDSAVVVVTNGSTQTEFFLVKVNGEWKVTGIR